MDVNIGTGSHVAINEEAMPALSDRNQIGEDALPIKHAFHWNVPPLVERTAHLKRNIDARVDSNFVNEDSEPLLHINLLSVDRRSLRAK